MYSNYIRSRLRHTRQSAPKELTALFRARTLFRETLDEHSRFPSCERPVHPAEGDVPLRLLEARIDHSPLLYRVLAQAAHLQP